VIGTDPAQIAVTSGALVREWRDKGRRYFHYRTEAPVRFGGAIFSAEYAVREAQWKAIPVRVYYHPTHDVNVDRMLRQHAGVTRRTSRGSLVRTSSASSVS
jgi:hypothetical protein